MLNNVKICRYLYKALFTFVIVSSILLAPSSYSFAASTVQTVTPELTYTMHSGEYSDFEVHYEENAWLYSKLDPISGYYQIYLQKIEDTDPAIAQPLEVRLTDSPFDKENPQWAGELESLTVIHGSTRISCTDSQGIYYKGNDNGDNYSEIHFACYQDLLTTSPNFIFDLKLSNITGQPSSDFRINDYTSHHEENISYYYTTTDGHTARFIAFTANQTLNSLMFKTIGSMEVTPVPTGTPLHFEPSALAFSTSDVVYNHQGPLGAHVWQDYLTNTVFERHANLEMDEHGFNVLFTANLSSAAGHPTKQLGIVNFTGNGEQQLTDFEDTIVDSKFHGSITADPSETVMIDGTPFAEDTVKLVEHIFLTLKDSGDTLRTVYLNINTTAGGTGTFNYLGTPIAASNGWCPTAYYISDDTSSRVSIDTKLIDNSGPNDGKTHLIYSKIQMTEEIGEIYSTIYDLPECETPLGTAPVQTISEDFVTNQETQHTCNNLDFMPKLLPDIYYNNSTTASSPSSMKGLTDAVFLRLTEVTPDINLHFAHLYGMDEPVEGCETITSDGGTTSTGKKDEEDKKDNSEATVTPQSNPATPDPDLVEFVGGFFLLGSSCDLRHTGATQTKLTTLFALILTFVIPFFGILILRLQPKRISKKKDF